VLLWLLLGFFWFWGSSGFFSVHVHFGGLRCGWLGCVAVNSQQRLVGQV
jgi:hypothetical protein